MLVLQFSPLKGQSQGCCGVPTTSASSISCTLPPLRLPSTAVAVKLTKRCMAMLKPGGRFLFANFRTARPMMVHGGVHERELLLRSDEEMWTSSMRALIVIWWRQASCPAPTVRLHRDIFE